MNALTRFEPDTPVRYDVMNLMCTEVEARDSDLQEQINDLNNDRGYLTSSILATFNITQNGKYAITSNSSTADRPLTHVTEGSWTLDITTTPQGIRQVSTLVWSNLSGYNDRGRAFKRIYVDGAWGAWQEIPTNTKTPFVCTATTGYMIISQDCYRIDNDFSITLNIKKTNNSMMTGAGLIATAPLSLRTVAVGSAMGLSATGWTESVNSYCDGNGVSFATSSTQTSELYITIKGAIL